MYELICRERFDLNDKKQDEILDLLRGTNGNPGLIHEIRTLKKRWALVFGSLIVIFSALITQLVRWLFSKV
jgi:hypothetical protein